MAWVTKDKRVVPTIRNIRRGALTADEARQALRNTAPEPGRDFFLTDWEIEEAILEAGGVPLECFGPDKGFPIQAAKL